MCFILNYLEMSNKNRTVVILQPSYIPWLGHFDQILNSDLFVYFDTVQYTRRDWRNRNYIKNRQEKKQWLTIPVQTKNNYHSLIKDMAIFYETDWIKQHLALVKESYRISPFFEPIFDIFQNSLQKRYESLSDLTIDLNIRFTQYLGINSVEFLRSSELELPPYKNASEHLAFICEQLNATHYFTGASSANYLDHSYFEKCNITISYQNYQHPIYPQLGSDFISNLSILDLLFNVGKDSLKILKNES